MRDDPFRFRLHIHSSTRHPPGWYPPTTGYPGSEYRQARCTPCGLRFVWRGAPQVGHANCPVCNKPLSQTMHYVDCPTVHALGKRRRI